MMPQYIAEEQKTVVINFSYKIYRHGRFEVLTAASTKMDSGRSLPTFQRYLLLLNQDALMMEAASTSETLVNFHQNTRRYKPEDSHLDTDMALLTVSL
jgi:hypothetical protein